MAKKNTTPATIDITPESALPTQLTEIAKTSGLELTEAQSIGAAFAPFMLRVNELTEAINAIPTENPTAEQSALARKYRLELVSSRGKNGLLETHKTIKEASLVRGRLIDSYKNVVEDSSKLAEMRAEGIEKHFENLERVRLDGVESERLARLTEMGTEPKYGVNIRLMDDETFEGYFNNEKLIIEAVKRDELERERLELEAANLVSNRTKLLVDAGTKFDGAIFSIGTISLQLSALKEMPEALFNTNVKNIKSEVDKVKAEQKRKDDELAAFKKQEDDKKALLLKRFNTRSTELTKAGFTFDAIAKMFKSDEHAPIPSSAIVNMEDKPWKEYLKSVVDAVNVYREQVKIKDKFKASAIQSLLENGFEQVEGGYQHSELDWFIGYRHFDSFINNEEFNDWYSQVKLQHAKLTQAKADAEALKSKQEAERKENERKAALLKAPDQAQVSEFYKQFKDFKFPELKSDAGKAMETKVNAALAELKSLILKEAKNLV